MIKGSCLCGEVKYEISGEMGPITHCHCPTCQKAHATAFSSVSSVQLDDLKFTAGGKLLKFFESSPGKKRYFCSNCGSQIYAKREDQNHYIFRMGTIDGDPGIRPAQHIFTRHKAPWYCLHDDIPEFSEWPTPSQESSSTTAAEFEQLHTTLRATLHLAIKREASTSLLLLKVHLRENEAMTQELSETIKHEIRGSVRASDIIEPMNESGFAVLLPYTDARAAQILQERIRKTVTTATQQTTFSIGAATLQADQLNQMGITECVDALINKSEQACRSSNSNGGKS